MKLEFFYSSYLVDTWRVMITWNVYPENFPYMDEIIINQLQVRKFMNCMSYDREYDSEIFKIFNDSYTFYTFHLSYTYEFRKRYLNLRLHGKQKEK